MARPPTPDDAGKSTTKGPEAAISAPVGRDSPDKADLLELIAGEMGSAQARLRHAGWTSWALLTALGGLAWLLLSSWPVTGWSVGASLVLLAVSATLDAVAVLDSSFSGSTQQSRYYRVTDLWVGTRGAILLRMIRATFLLWILTTTVTSSLPAIVLGSWYFVAALSYLIALPLSYWLIPLPNNPRGEKFTTVAAVVFALATIVSAVVLVAEWANPFAAVLGDVKAGLLAAVLLMIPEKLAATHRPPTVVSELERIRRELLLGEVNLEGAARQTRIVLLGRDASELTETLLADASRLYGDLEAKTEKTGQIIREVRGVPISSDPDAMNKMSAKLDEAEALVEEMMRVTQRVANFRKRFSYVMTMSTLSENDRQWVLSTLLEMSTRTSGAVKALRAEARAARQGAQNEAARLRASINP